MTTNIIARGRVVSLHLLDAVNNVYQANINVFAVNGHKLGTPIMVDEKMSGARLAAYHADKATEGFNRGAIVSFKTSGINEISHRELPAKDGYPARPLFSLTGPMTELTVESGVKPREFAVAADKLEPTPAVAAPETLLDKAMGALGLTRAAKPKKTTKV